MPTAKEGISPERLALAAMALGVVLMCAVGAAIPAGYALQRRGLIKRPVPYAWTPPGPPGGVPTLAPAATALATSAAVVDIDFGDDPSELFVLRRGGTVERLDATTGSVEVQGMCYASAARIHHAADADMLVVLSPGDAEFLDAKTLAPLREPLVFAHPPGFLNVGGSVAEIVDPSGRWLLGMCDSSASGSFAFWSLETGDRGAPFGMPNGRPWSMAACFVSPTTAVLAAADPMNSANYEHIVASTETDGVVARWVRPNAQCPTAMAPDGTGGVVQHSCDGMRRLDPATGALTSVGTLSTNYCNAAVSRDGRYVCDVLSLGVVHDTSIDRQVGWLPFRPACVAEFSPDGRWLARGADDGAVEIFDMAALPTGAVPTPTPTPAEQTPQE